MKFKLNVIFEGKTIAKGKGNKLKDFDPIISDLKEKFGEGGKYG